MPTNDERRAVAAGLRRLEDATAHLPMSDSNFYSLLSGVVFNGANWDIHDRNPNGLFLNRLADLIEPESERTCRDECGGELDFHCSECGCHLYLISIENEPSLVLGEAAIQPSFCPNCGAKVVHE